MLGASLSASTMPVASHHRMRSSARHLQFPPRRVAALAFVAALALPAGALGAPMPPRNTKPAQTPGSLAQLPGARGCLVDRSVHGSPCGTARALEAPAPFLGSRAIALSPDGKQRLRRLLAKRRDRDLQAQPADRRADAAAGARPAASPPKAPAAARTAVGLDGPNSVAVSPDGRNVYATSRGEQLGHRLPPQPARPAP